MARRGGGNGTGVGRGRLFEEILIANKGYVLLARGREYFSPSPLSRPLPPYPLNNGNYRYNPRTCALVSEKLGPRREHPQQAFLLPQANH